MALLTMKRLHTEEDPSTGNAYFVLHCDSLASAGESRCYAKVLRMDLAPDVQRALSNGQAVEMELDPEALISNPKERREPHELWPYPEKV